MKKLLQPDLFSMANPPVKATVTVPVQNCSPTVKTKGITAEERALCIELLGHDREEITCSHCGENFLIYTFHIRSCPMSPGGVGKAPGQPRRREEETPIPSAPASGIIVHSSVAPRPLSQIGAPSEWIGQPTRCSICGELAPTYRHLDLVHGCQPENLRRRLISAHLSTELGKRADALNLDVAQLRELILCGGNPERHKRLRLLEGFEEEEIERSPNSDPSSLTGKHPYKGKGVADGASMAPKRWMGKK